MKNIKTFGMTDVGMVRERNEDSFTIFRYTDMAVLCVADGMGGHTNGQLASTTVVKTIKEYFDNNMGKESIEELVESSILLSKKKLDEAGSNLPPNASMGTTCTMGVVQRDLSSGSGVYKVTMGHVGDSKLYHISEDDIAQVSTDHTMLQKMIDANALSPEEIENYPHKNIIYKSISTGKELDLDPIIEFNLLKGDMLLLCSDGLSGYLSPEEMLNILKGTKNMNSAAQYMINLAKHRGGDDNITVTLAEAGNFKREKSVKLQKVPLVKRGKTKKKGKKKLPLMLFLITILIALAVALFLVLKNDLRIEDIKGSDQKPEVRSQKSVEKEKSETNANDRKANEQKGETEKTQNDELLRPETDSYSPPLGGRGALDVQQINKEKDKKDKEKKKKDDEEK